MVRIAHQYFSSEYQVIGSLPNAADQYDRKVRTDPDQGYVDRIAEFKITRTLGIEQDFIDHFEPVKLTPEYPFQQAVVLKRNDHAEHRRITENTDQNDRRQEQKIQHLVPHDTLPRLSRQECMHSRTERAATH